MIMFHFKFIFVPLSKTYTKLCGEEIRIMHQYPCSVQYFVVVFLCLFDMVVRVTAYLMQSFVTKNNGNIYSLRIVIVTSVITRIKFCCASYLCAHIMTTNDASSEQVDLSVERLSFFEPVIQVATDAKSVISGRKRFRAELKRTKESTKSNAPTREERRGSARNAKKADVTAISSASTVKRRRSNSASDVVSAAVAQAKSAAHRGPERSRAARIAQRNAELTTALAASDILLPETVGSITVRSDTDAADDDDGTKPIAAEKTYRLSQEVLTANVDQRTRDKLVNLTLTGNGSYTHRYSADGRHVLLTSRRGHIGLIDTHNNKLRTEINVNQTCRAATFCQSRDIFAVAQDKAVYLYDQSGIELHHLATHVEPTCLEYLRYHFLLCSIGRTGYITYTDVSTGEHIGNGIKTHRGACHVMTQNRYNSVIVTGHSNGTVAMWAPNTSQPLLTMLTHKTALTGIAIDITGNYMSTTSADNQLHIWDIRQTYRQLYSYFTVRTAHSIAFSDTGILAVGMGSHVHCWKDITVSKQQSPYLVNQYRGRVVNTVGFIPFEDILGVSHDNGYAAMLVPGSGEPNLDNELNPFASKHVRREQLVRSLLEKLKPDMIRLGTDNNQLFGLMNAESRAAHDQAEKAKRAEQSAAMRQVSLERNHKRGGGAVSKQLQRKRLGTLSEQREVRREHARSTVAPAAQAAAGEHATSSTTALPLALQRFTSKPESDRNQGENKRTKKHKI